jgi:hypothetical protein
MKRRHLFTWTEAGHGSVTKSNKAAALLAALVLGLFGTAGIATAQDQLMGNAPNTPAASRRQANGRQVEWLRIMAFTDAPVVGADVRVSVHRSQGRPLVDVHAATNDQGVFAVAVRSQPSFFRVTVTGGTTNGNPFPWHLSADVELTDPAHQIVVVNPVTTLVSLVLDQRPNLKLDGAEALVRTFLTLPANYPLGMALRQSSGYKSPFFSPVVFVTEAEAAGGLDAFVHLLLQELASDSAAHSFRQPQLLGEDPEVFIATNLAAGALKYVGGQGAGWVMAQTGLPTTGTNSGDIASLQQALVNLTSAIENLAFQVSQLNALVKATATQNLYVTITTTAQTYATLITNHESDLSFYAQYCPPLAEGSTPPTTVDPYCSTNQPIVISELQAEYTGKDYEQVQSFVQDNGTLGTEGMLHLYSLWLFETRPAFFRAADSTKMQNLYAYWDSVLTSAANLRMELFHYLGDQNSSGGTAQITAFMGSPDLSPPTTGTFQANETANQKLTFPPVPAGTVVSTVDRTMWALVPWQPDPNHPGYLYPAAGCATSKDPDFYTEYPNNVNRFNEQPVYAGMPTGWAASPTKDQWQAAVKNAPPGTDWQQWLIDQTKTTSGETPASAGFFNGQSCPHASWTSTIDSSYYWAIFPNGQSTFVQAHQGDTNLVWPWVSFDVYSGPPWYMQFFWTN